MSIKYRQSIIVELEGSTEEALFNARLKFERAMAGLGAELSKLKDSGNIIAVLPDKVRSWESCGEGEGLKPEVEDLWFTG